MPVPASATRCSPFRERLGDRRRERSLLRPGLEARKGRGERPAGSKDLAHACKITDANGCSHPTQGDRVPRAYCCRTGRWRHKKISPGKSEDPPELSAGSSEPEDLPDPTCGKLSGERRPRSRASFGHKLPQRARICENTGRRRNWCRRPSPESPIRPLRPIGSLEAQKISPGKSEDPPELSAGSSESEDLPDPTGGKLPGDSGRVNRCRSRNSAKSGNFVDLENVWTHFWRTRGLLDNRRGAGVRPTPPLAFLAQWSSYLHSSSD